MEKLIYVLVDAKDSIDGRVERVGRSRKGPSSLVGA